MSAAPERIEAWLVPLIQRAVAGVDEARAALIRAEGALVFIERFASERHGLGEHDTISLDGTITRAPATPGAPAE